MDLKHIPINRVQPNVKNPRGIDIASNDEKLPLLKDSISKFGVLVPIVVTPINSRYLLLDGERRFHAAKAAGLLKIPAFIVSGNAGKMLTESEILFRMFQIHHVREDWGPVQQCRALEDEYNSIIRSARIKQIPDIRAAASAAADELSLRTGLDARTAFDRVKFLRWPADIRKKLYDHPEESGHWYICEIEDKIIIPALVNYPEYFENVDVNEVRRMLFSKIDGALTRSTDVRKIAPYLRADLESAQDRRKVKKVLNDLVNKPDMTYEDAQNDLQKEFPKLFQRDPASPRKITSLITALETELERFDTTTLSTATKRAYATQSEVLSAAEALAPVLSEFIRRVKGVGR